MTPYQSDSHPIPNIGENPAKPGRAAASASWAARFIDALPGLPGPAIFTTSFGLEDQAITHVIAETGLSVSVVTLDTGRLFPETLELWAETERRYGLRITGLAPGEGEAERLVAAQGPLGFRASPAARKECCRVRKLAPIARALANHAVWITGIRADQSRMRQAAGFLEYDPGFGIQKLNPLFDQTRAAIAAFCRDNGVPVNALHARNYLSVGCAPCTRALRPGEEERAGRWWWEQEGKSECGLHLSPEERL